MGDVKEDLSSCLWPGPAPVIEDIEWDEPAAGSFPSIERGIGR